ncbi:MAG: dTDP-4-dehydrorhamnose 3,5-epimerase family protein [Rhodospirillaceae bacterium]|nr:dTDP-4-dehydrorhamnose 3,5-epimerase family protein [Rhodospirillaceae bacterium]
MTESIQIDGIKGKWIDGVKIVRKRKIVDERGMIMHMMKTSDDEFQHFGEIYFSCGQPGVVKAWHIHKEMTLNNCCIVGMIKLVLFDGRDGSPTRGNLMECFIGEDNYCLVQIPSGITNGYKAFGSKMAILANCATLPHDPSELIYIDPFNNDIPYDWAVKHG